MGNRSPAAASLHKLLEAAKKALREALDVSFILFRVMVPVIIVVKVLQEAGAIGVLASILSPVMRVVGLPGEMGLVWATALVTNLYGGVAVFLSLAPETPLTVAQVTVLASMMLVAHAMLIELRVAQKAGVRMRFLGSARLVSAFLLGLLLHLVYSATGTLQGPSRLFWKPTPPGGSLQSWALGQLRNLVMIFVIVLVLVILMKVLRRLGVTRLLNRALRPVLTSMGIGESAATITLVGMLLGLSYGGGLIIKEARSGRLSSRDVFFSVSLMALAHAVIEDTLLMSSLGANLSGVLFGRVLFAWLMTAALARLLSRVPERVFDRWFYRPGS
jgi:hypothetical protein